MEAHCKLLIFHRSSQIINSDTFTRYKTKEWNPNRHSSITMEGILRLHSRRGFHAASHPFPQTHTHCGTNYGKIALTVVLIIDDVRLSLWLCQCHCQCVVYVVHCLNENIKMSKLKAISHKYKDKIA